jgi:hypothetical protein
MPATLSEIEMKEAYLLEVASAMRQRLAMKCSEMEQL